MEFDLTPRLSVQGVDAEGLYRVAGFHDDVEAIKMSFDKGNQFCLIYANQSLTKLKLWVVFIFTITVLDSSVSFVDNICE